MDKTAVKLQRDLELEIQELQARLAEAEDTLRAIQHGEVDALLVETPGGEKIFTLQGADYPYRILVQEMSEGAVTVERDGTILYRNQRFARLLNKPIEQVFGSSLAAYVSPSSTILAALLQHAGKGEITLQTAEGMPVPDSRFSGVMHIDDLA
jgi:PAS domain-containing protein